MYTCTHIPVCDLVLKEELLKSCVCTCSIVLVAVPIACMHPLVYRLYGYLCVCVCNIVMFMFHVGFGTWFQYSCLVECGRFELTSDGMSFAIKLVTVVISWF